MAKPQLEDGYCRLSNELLDAFARLQLSGNDWRVLHFIIRKTYGYGKKVDNLANSQICEATDLKKTVVSRALKKLQDSNITLYNGKSVGLQKDYEQWKVIGRQQKLAKSATSETSESLPNLQRKLAKSATKVSHRNVTQKIKDKRKKGSTKVDPRIKEIFDVIEQKLGSQIPFHAKEGAAIKRALSMGFTPEEIIGCWEAMKGETFWQAKWLPLAKVTENLGEYRSGRLSDEAKTKTRRVTGGRTKADFTGDW